MAEIDWVSAGSGFVGVLVGGGITFFIEHHFRRDERKRLRMQRLNRLHRFTGMLFNEVGSLHAQILAKVRTQPDVPIWRYLVPMIGVDPTPISYDIDDLSVTGGPKYDELTAKLILIAARRNACVATLAHYNIIRTQLLEVLAQYSTVDDKGIATTSFAYRTNAAVVMQEQGVESLAKVLTRDLSALLELVHGVLDPYNAMIADLYGPKNIARLTMIKAAAETKAAG